ncbi:hypothetical protein HDU91_003517, partial [Kappamyces sp. JEL0680]
GVVSKVSPDHIACVVHGLFNASIAKDQLPPNSWTWDADNHYWSGYTNNGQVVLTQGSIIKFRVTKLETKGDMISIRGSLLPKSAPVGLLETNSIAPPPSFVVEPEPVAPVTPKPQGIVDLYADDETEEVSKHVVFADDSDADEIDNEEQDYPEDEDDTGLAPDASEPELYFASPPIAAAKANETGSRSKKSRPSDTDTPAAKEKAEHN